MGVNDTNESLNLEIFDLRDDQVGGYQLLKFGIGFYATYRRGTINPNTMETESCDSGHYAFCTTQMEPF